MEKFVILVQVVFLLVGCNFGKTVKDSEIAPEIRKEIKALTEYVIECCVQNQPDKVLEVASSVFRNDFGESLKNDIAQKGFVFDSGKYKTLNEFYLEGLKKGVQVKISSGTDVHDYFLRINPSGEKMYCSVGYFDTKDEQISLILIWVREADKWLLNYMHAGVITIAHKDVIDWFDEVKLHYERGEMCDAGMKLMIVSKLLNKNLLPLIYNQEQELKAQGKQIINSMEAGLKFPYTVDQIASRPSVLRFVPIISGDTLLPVAQYVSEIEAGEDASLKSECDSLHNILGKIYKGIDKNNSKLIYQVFSSMPTDNRTPPHHTFVQEFKNE